MCTVSFLPLNSGFILTSNRDEKALRKKAIFPSVYNSKSGEIKFPKDGQSGGTWIAIGTRKMICLLNGGFENHIKKSSYRHSRGQVVLDAFDYSSFEDFRACYNFQDLEPFTLVMVEYTANITLTELRWDGQKKHILSMDASQSHIWSSVTLYDSDTIAERKSWFENFISTKPFTIDTIKDFHKTGGNGDSRNDLIMKRENSLQTLSVTSVEYRQDNLTMQYEELID